MNLFKIGNNLIRCIAIAETQEEALNCKDVKKYFDNNSYNKELHIEKIAIVEEIKINFDDLAIEYTAKEWIQIYGTFAPVIICQSTPPKE